VGGLHFSGKTGEAAALSGVGGCLPASYNIMLQYIWCMSEWIAPCSLLEQSR